jgi:hypothetical protein
LSDGPLVIVHGESALEVVFGAGLPGRPACAIFVVGAGD